MASYKQATSAYTTQIAKDILAGIKAKKTDQIEERLSYIEDMLLSGRVLTPIFDSSGHMILDSAGKVIVTERQI